MEKEEKVASDRKREHWMPSDAQDKVWEDFFFRGEMEEAFEEPQGAQEAGEPTRRVWKEVQGGHIQVGYISKFLSWAEELALAREMESLRSPGQVSSIKHKGHDTGRLGTSFGDKGVQYSFAGQTYEAKGWTPMTLKIRNRVQKFSGKRINYCLLTIYPKGRMGLGWHKDDEREIIPRSMIASVSIGRVG